MPRPDPLEGSSNDDDTSPGVERPEFLPENMPWPQESKGSIEQLVPPLLHVWPRLPPDYPYHLPPGFWWTANMPHTKEHTGTAQHAPHKLRSIKLTYNASEQIDMGQLPHSRQKMTKGSRRE